MSIRFYYYISKSKVEMLKGQIQTKSRLSKINPKVEGFGLSVELGIETENDKSGDSKLAHETNNLIDILSEEKLIVSLKGVAQFDSSTFYHDEGDWAHGLYSVHQASADSYIVTYMLWKASGSRLFLLFGSPMNVLGTKEVKEGMEHNPGSSSIINNVIETSLQDEFIGAIYDCGKADSSEKPSVTIPSSQDSRFKINVENWIPSAHLRAERNVLRGSALAVLCQKALISLPCARIETVFKVYHTLPVSRSIAPFDALYLGSPIFVALK